MACGDGQKYERLKRWGTRDEGSKMAVPGSRGIFLKILLNIKNHKLLSRKFNVPRFCLYLNFQLLANILTKYCGHFFGLTKIIGKYFTDNYWLGRSKKRQNSTFNHRPLTSQSMQCPTVRL